jgi:hypothetical protein
MRKNKIFLLVLLLGVTTLFSSCLDIMLAVLETPQTYKILLNEYTPVEQNVTLTYPGSLIMKKWNGTDMVSVINEKNNKKPIYLIDKVILTLPAGNNSFIFDIYIIFDKSTSYTSYRVPNVELPYLLEAGKKYEIKTSSKSLGRSKGYEFFAGIYDVTNKSELLKEWKIGESQ